MGTAMTATISEPMAKTITEILQTTAGVYATARKFTVPEEQYSVDGLADPGACETIICPKT